MTTLQAKDKLATEDFIKGAVKRGGTKPAVPPAGQQPSFYANRKKVYPKLGRGYFRNVKWAVMAVTLGIYYLMPWIRWNRGPNLPDQAVLFDFANQRLFFGPLQVHAQEFYFVTGLLVISALGLFLVTAIAGRMWCGYACPQTVWTDLMIAVERFWQGDRNAHMRLDQGPWTLEKIWKKAGTHATFLLISVLTGGAFVFYFRDAPTLAIELLNGTAPSVAYAFVAIFTLSTYVLGGIAREQVCIYMCPWPRIQGAMLDKDSLLVSYLTPRGEPRGPHKKGDSWEGRGDCVDCTACVTVCPMGIDIRNGPQLECIQCALCIDACDAIMTKVGRPTGLIAYATFQNVDHPTAGPREGWRIVRPRTLLYAAALLLASGLLLWAMLSRTTLDVSILHDRNPLYVTLSDGGLRNGYTIKIHNKLLEPRRLRIDVGGIDGARATILGQENKEPVVDLAPAEVAAVKLYLSVPPAAISRLAGEAVPVTIAVTDTADQTVTVRESTFRSPPR
jgi:cytochrome c oxidase accessory protein FixG